MDRTIIEDDPDAFAAVRQPAPLRPRCYDRPAPDVLTTVVLRVVKQREAARAHSEVTGVPQRLDIERRPN